MKIAIIGTGQQGTSIAGALKSGDFELSAYDINPQVREAFSNITGVESSTTLADAVSGAQVVMLATPIDRFADTVREIAPYVQEGVIITDIGSGKVKSIEAISGALSPDMHYVPVHPIAGSAGVGPETGKSDMYKNQTVAIVAEKATSETARETIETLWAGMGGKITYMSAETHDRLYGTISHFEHVVAFALTQAGEASTGKASSVYKIGGNSLLDTTRIARASVDMWVPIFRDNRDAILAAAEGFKSRLNDLKAAMEWNNKDELSRLVGEAHIYRSAIPEARFREGLSNEYYDIENRPDLDREQKLFAVTQTVSIPAVIGTAITLNAKDTERVLRGVKIAQVANPSFLDGSAPVLEQPDFLAFALYSDKENVLDQIDLFEEKFDALVAAIRDGNEAAIRKTIENASSIRSNMPPHRAANDMRPGRVYEVPQAIA